MTKQNPKIHNPYNMQNTNFELIPSNFYNYEGYRYKNQDFSFTNWNPNFINSG
jgi:hypothetical protein